MFRRKQNQTISYRFASKAFRATSRRVRYFRRKKSQRSQKERQLIQALVIKSCKNTLFVINFPSRLVIKYENLKEKAVAFVGKLIKDTKINIYWICIFNKNAQCLQNVILCIASLLNDCLISVFINHPIV